jgi:hypothetical protein
MLNLTGNYNNEGVLKYELYCVSSYIIINPQSPALVEMIKTYNLRLQLYLNTNSISSWLSTINVSLF